MPRIAIALAAAFLIVGILAIGLLFFSTGPTQNNPQGPGDGGANSTRQ